MIAATHCDLEKAIEEGRFRADLYYRLNVINLLIPPLRERAEDIIAIAEFLLKKHTPSGTVIPILARPLKEALLSYSWPGNIRELENLVRRFIILRNPETLVRELQSKTVRRMPVATMPTAQSAMMRAMHDAVIHRISASMTGESRIDSDLRRQAR